jgi:hypothetical protein
MKVIESVNKIRKQIHDQIIFMFCRENQPALSMISNINLDIDNLMISCDRWSFSVDNIKEITITPEVKWQ